MADSAREPSLTVRTAKSAGWIVAWRMSSRLLGIVNTIVLVRLLLPADFGLVALATSLSQSLEGMVSVGVNEALIREPVLDRALFNTGFTINLIRCLLVSLCLVAGAWPAGTFFDDTRLTPILLALAGIVMITACENIGAIEFRRNLVFEKDFQIQFIPRVAAIATSIVFAVIFENYWALVAGILVQRSMRLALTYWMHPYRPGITLRSWRRIVGFSFWTWIGAIVTMLKERMDAVVIGRVLGAAKVGVYAVGLEIGTLASTELLEPITTALFAGFSAGRREGTDVAQSYFKAISVTLMVTLPIGVGISLVAAPLISLLFGSRWLEAIPLVQIFSLLGVTRAINYFSSVLLAAHAMLPVQFRISVAGLVVRLVLLLSLIAPFGLMGAVIAAVAGALLEEALFLIVTFRLFELRAIDLFRGIWRGIAAVAVMALVVWSEGVGWAAPPEEHARCVIELATAVASGAATYCLLLLILWLLSGRPAGAETMFFSIARDTWNHAMGSLFRRRG